MENVILFSIIYYIYLWPTKNDFLGRKMVKISRAIVHFIYPQIPPEVRYHQTQIFPTDDLQNPTDLWNYTRSSNTTGYEIEVEVEIHFAYIFWYLLHIFTKRFWHLWSEVWDPIVIPKIALVDFGPKLNLVNMYLVYE